MATIKCPNCGKEIQLDKSEYDALLNEVEKDEVEKRVKEKTQSIEATLKAQYELEKNKANSASEATVKDLESKINVLNEQIKGNAQATELAVQKAVTDAKEALANKEKEIISLEAKVKDAKKDADIATQKLKDDYENQLKLKDQDIARWREYRLGDSTKDLGESLEQYCSDKFNEIRLVAYPKAYFEKDNDVVEGGKGDFIFRDFSDDGIETVSIMFDMKNEKDTTSTKHKNEDFFKKLDADRVKKNCEYAVLVSTLEADSAYYNAGIVEVYGYKKMYVVRPQQFLTIIGLLKNMALGSYEYKKELVAYKEQNLDVSNFEDKVNAISDKINADYAKANGIYSSVDDMCDAMIKKINEFRSKFATARDSVGKAVKELDNLSIRKLSWGNKTLKAMFAEAEESK